MTKAEPESEQGIQDRADPVVVVPPPRRPGALAAVIGIVAVLGVVLKVGVDPLVAAGNGIVRLATEPHEAKHPKIVVSEPAKPPEPSDPLQGVPQEVKAELTRPEADGTEGFRFVVTVPPPAFCAAMKDAGLPNGGWKKVGEGLWQCMTDLVPVPGSKAVAPDPADLPAGVEPWEPRQSSLFLDARGATKDSLDVIRFKLNLDDPSVDAAGRRMLLDALGVAAQGLSWSLPATVEDAILRHRKLALASGGIRIDVHPESEPVRRLNVVLLLREPALRLPADRFVVASPLPRGLSSDEEPPASAAGEPLPLPVGRVPLPVAAPARP